LPGQNGQGPCPDSFSPAHPSRPRTSTQLPVVASCAVVGTFELDGRTGVESVPSGGARMPWSCARTPRRVTGCSFVGATGAPGRTSRGTGPARSVPATNATRRPRSGHIDRQAVPPTLPTGKVRVIPERDPYFAIERELIRKASGCSTAVSTRGASEIVVEIVDTMRPSATRRRPSSPGSVDVPGPDPGPQAGPEDPRRRRDAALREDGCAHPASVLAYPRDPHRV